MFYLIKISKKFPINLSSYSKVMTYLYLSEFYYMTKNKYNCNTFSIEFTKLKKYTVQVDIL